MLVVFVTVVGVAVAELLVVVGLCVDVEDVCTVDATVLVLVVVTVDGTVVVVIGGGSDPVR